VHDGIDHGLRFLATGGVIEVNQRLIAYFFAEDGKVGADLVDW